jgi:hypothetical protein
MKTRKWNSKKQEWEIIEFKSDLDKLKEENKLLMKEITRLDNLRYKVGIESKKEIKKLEIRYESCGRELKDYKFKLQRAEAKIVEQKIYFIKELKEIVKIDRDDEHFKYQRVGKKILDLIKKLKGEKE